MQSGSGGEEAEGHLSALSLVTVVDLSAIHPARPRDTAVTDHAAAFMAFPWMKQVNKQQRSLVAGYLAL